MYVRYILDETLISLRKSFSMLVCSAVIVTASLALFGMFIISDRAFSRVAAHFENNLEVVAFLEDGYNEGTVKNAIMPAISTYPGVASVRLVTKDEARRELSKDVPELDELFSVIEENPLPASLRVKVKSPDMLSQVTAKMKKENGIAISDVTYGGESANAVLSGIAGMRRFMLVCLVLFTIASIIVTAATIRITVTARRDDIEIMKLVGATDWYIKWPYIIEGILLGLVSGAAATLLMLFFRNGAVAELGRSVTMFGALADAVSIPELCFKLVTVGVLQGIIGAMWSTASVLSEKF